MSAVEAKHVPGVAGYLLKLGAINQSWKKRWCIVYKGDPKLFYFIDDSAKKPKSFIPLENACVRVPSDEKRKFLFQIATPDRVYHLVSSSSEDLARWVEIISSFSSLRRENEIFLSLDSMMEYTAHSRAQVQMKEFTAKMSQSRRNSVKTPDAQRPPSRNSVTTKSFPSVKASVNQNRSVFPLTSSSSSSSSSSSHRPLASSTGTVLGNTTNITLSENRQRDRSGASSSSSASSFSYKSSLVDSTIDPQTKSNTPDSSASSSAPLLHSSEIIIKGNANLARPYPKDDVSVAHLSAEIDHIEFEVDAKHKAPEKSPENANGSESDSENEVPQSQSSTTNLEIESFHSISSSSSLSSSAVPPASNHRPFQSASNSLSTFFRPLSTLSRRTFS